MIDRVCQLVDPQIVEALHTHDAEVTAMTERGMQYAAIMALAPSMIGPRS